MRVGLLRGLCWDMIAIIVVVEGEDEVTVGVDFPGVVVGIVGADVYLAIVGAEGHIPDPELPTVDVVDLIMDDDK